MNETPSPETVIRRQLYAGEELLWFGVPDAEVKYTPMDRLLVPTGYAIGMVVFLWEVAAIATVFASRGGGFFLPLFGLPFAVMAWYAVWGRMIYKRRARRTVVYGITNRRAMLVQTAPPRRSEDRVWSRDLPVHRLLGLSGTGGICFGAPTRWQGWLENSGLEVILPRSARTALMFHDLRDGDGAYELAIFQRDAAPRSQS